MKHSTPPHPKKRERKGSARLRFVEQRLARDRQVGGGRAVGVLSIAGVPGGVPRTCCSAIVVGRRRIRTDALRRSPHSLNL